MGSERKSCQSLDKTIEEIIQFIDRRDEEEVNENERIGVIGQIRDGIRDGI